MTPGQLAGLIEESGFILYLRDRAFKQYHFGKLDKEARQELLKETEVDEMTKQAINIFYQMYDMPEFRGHSLDVKTYKDLTEAINSDFLPGWAYPLLKIGEVKK